MYKAYRNRAGVWFEKNELEKAVADCSAAIALNARTWRDYVMRGDLYYRLQQYDKARSDYLEGVKRAGQDLAPIRQLVNLLTKCPEEAYRDPNQAIIDAVARTLPAVVDLEVFATGPAVRVLGRERRGSGVVVTADGHILTASHVVMGAERLNVTFSDGRRVAGRLTAMDPETGLALLHIAPFPGMVVASLGNSAGLKLGQACVALSSLGHEVRTVNAGVISAFAPFEGWAPR